MNTKTNYYQKQIKPGKLCKYLITANIPKKYKNAALAIGNFDGVHKGHQEGF